MCRVKVPDGPGDEAQRFEFISGETSAFDTFQMRPTTISVPVGAQFGPWIQIGLKIDVDAWDGWRGVRVSLTDPVSGFRTFGLKSIDRARFELPKEDWAGWIWTEAVEVTAANMVLRPLVKVDIAGNGHPRTGVITIEDAVMRVVEDLRDDLRSSPLLLLRRPQWLASAFSGERRTTSSTPRAVRWGSRDRRSRKQQLASVGS